MNFVESLLVNERRLEFGGSGVLISSNQVRASTVKLTELSLTFEIRLLVVVVFLNRPHPCHEGRF